MWLWDSATSAGQRDNAPGRSLQMRSTDGANQAVPRFGVGHRHHNLPYKR